MSLDILQTRGKISSSNIYFLQSVEITKENHNNNDDLTNNNDNFRWWSDVNMLRVLVEAARHEGNPLLKLSNTMKWQISFGDHEITELERYLEIIGPLEEMFNSLNSTQSTIQRVIPSIKVNTSILKLLFVCFVSLENAEDS